MQAVSENQFINQNLFERKFYYEKIIIYLVGFGIDMCLLFS